MLQRQLFVENLVLFKAELEIFLDKKVGELREGVGRFNLAIALAFFLGNIKKYLSYVSVVESVVVHHLKIKNTENADLLEKLLINKSVYVNKEEGSCVVSVEFFVIVYLIYNYIHLIQKVTSINCLQFNSDFL